MKEGMQQELFPDKYARIDNQFVFNARYRLPAREQKIILYIISKINPIAENEFHKQRLSISELKQLLVKEGAKYGSFYNEIATISETMTNCKITFPTSFEINGTRMKGAINWFQHCIPVEDENGELYLEFVFSEILKPFIIDLKEYVKIGVADVFPMRSGYAIRMFQILKAEFDRLKEHRKIVLYEFSMNELKQCLGIEDKYNYPDFKNFRVRVLDPIKEDINEFSNHIHIDYDYLKTGKKVTGIRFIISAKENKPKGEERGPSVLKEKKTKTTTKANKIIEKLSRSQKKTLELLTNFGVFEGIVLTKILPTLIGSEIEGFEDIFTQKALDYFKKNAHQQDTPELSAQTFVVWWLDKEVFNVKSESSIWSLLMEQLTDEKKRMAKHDVEAFDNRLMAKTMSNADFEKWYRSK
jgi:plasmid replication initiation protein